ncbi:MAG: hypothetical protein KY468_12125 [Armatimonadetes bacterium]|nr:hypothetical protein [Armatimonadota bacterium]
MSDAREGGSGAGRIGPEERVEALRPWLRNSYLPAFQSAMAWGWPRCRTDDERLLYPLLLVALTPYNAVVAPRRMPEGGVVSFQVSISRADSSGVERFRWSVLSGEMDEEEDGLELSLRLPVDLVREQPWRAAARVIEEIQVYLLESTEHE